MNDLPHPQSIDATAEALWRSHSPELTNFATGLVGPADAPDVVTDAFLRARSKIGTGTVANPRAYLYRCVANRAHDHRRSEHRRMRREIAAYVPAADPAIADYTDLRRALANLTVAQRAVVVLTYWNDLPERAVADLLGLSPGTVHKLLDKARTTLRQSMAEDDDRDFGPVLLLALGELMRQAPIAAPHPPRAASVPPSPPNEPAAARASTSVGGTGKAIIAAVVGLLAVVAVVVWRLVTPTEQTSATTAAAVVSSTPTTLAPPTTAAAATVPAVVTNPATTAAEVDCLTTVQRDFGADATIVDDLCQDGWAYVDSCTDCGGDTKLLARMDANRWVIGVSLPPAPGQPRCLDEARAAGIPEPIAAAINWPACP